MMTVSTPRSASRAAEVSSRKSDSGVVMRMSVGCLAKARRSCAGVSPERTPTRTLGAGSPRRRAAPAIPTSGERRLRSTSTASAFSGETYSTRHVSGGGSASSVARELSRSRAQRKADSVLPEPVGATTRVCSPEAIASHACSCALVGPAKAPVNQARVAGEKRASTEASATIGAPPAFLAATIRAAHRPSR